MVNENGKPICYKWLSNECQWDKVGDVLSASNPDKNMHEGRVSLTNNIVHDYFKFSILL